MRLLAGFTRRRVEVGEVALQAAVAGDGPPVVLLHGFPQTHVAWHAVAPRLAERFTVVCPTCAATAAAASRPATRATSGTPSAPWPRTCEG